MKSVKMSTNSKNSRSSRGLLANKKVPILLAALAIAIVVAAFMLFRGGEIIATYTPVSSIQDIHGLAVDPNDPEILYVATHQGLIRGINDADWALVGNYRADFMGFSMHPNGKTFYSSGHKIPDAPLMGVGRSDDGGHNWQIIGLRGKVDFHTLTISKANPQILYGWYYRDGKLYKSVDGGYQWQNPRAVGLGNVVAVIADPTDEVVIWAATQRGLLRSSDGGELFQLVAFPEQTVTAAAIDPTKSNIVYAWIVNTGLHKSLDGGETWLPVGSGLTMTDQDMVAHFAIDPLNPERIYAATSSAAIYKSLDGGITWQLVKSS